MPPKLDHISAVEKYSRREPDAKRVRREIDYCRLTLKPGPEREASDLIFSRQKHPELYKNCYQAFEAFAEACGKK